MPCGEARPKATPSGEVRRGHPLILSTTRTRRRLVSARQTINTEDAESNSSCLTAGRATATAFESLERVVGVIFELKHKHAVDISSAVKECTVVQILPYGVRQRPCAEMGKRDPLGETGQCRLLDNSACWVFHTRRTHRNTKHNIMQAHNDPAFLNVRPCTSGTWKWRPTRRTATRERMEHTGQTPGSIAHAQSRINGHNSIFIAEVMRLFA